MPFTPLHMGPGILVKSLLRGSFSLMIFGWTQIVMDIQPLIVIISGEGHLHGFTHTYVGAILIALFSAVTGKPLSELGLKMLDLKVPGVETTFGIVIGWWVCVLSAAIGSFSHVLLDSIMHADVEPFYPFTLTNHFHGWLSIESLHKICIYTGLVGGVIFYSVSFYLSKASAKQ